MILNEQYLMIQMGEDSVLVPVGEAATHFRGIIRLNTTAKDIWQGLSDGLTEEQISENLVQKYDNVDLEKAQQEVKELIKEFRTVGIVND